MAIAYSATLKNARLQLVADLIASLTPAASTGTPTAGKLVIGKSNLAGGSTGVLATFDLETDPFSISGGIATLEGVPLTATATATGAAAKAEIRNNAGTVIANGLTVGTSGTHIIVPNTSIYTGGDVVVTAGTITHG